MTPERLAEIEARVDAATPGPWRTKTNRDFGPWHNDDWDVTAVSDGCRVSGLGSRNWKDACQNAAFIAHARTDIPDLIAEVKRLREIIGELERLTDLYYDAISPVTGKHAFTDGRGNYIHVEDNQG